MTEFEVGEIIHILNEEPPEEKVIAAGTTPLDWVDATYPYAGRTGTIVENTRRFQEHGWEYIVDFGDDRVDFYGIDFREFYEEQKSVLTPEALITLLG